MKMLMSFLLFSVAQPLLANAPCTLARVTSEEDGIKYSGTAFAISATELVVNEHTLPLQPTRLVVEKEKVSQLSAQIMARDFHTDLALLEVPNANFSACSFETLTPLKQMQLVSIMGWDFQSKGLTTIAGRFMDLASGKLMVPGVPRAQEIQNVQGVELPLRGSLSGSVVLAGDKVVGMVSQKSKEGTALSIPASTILRFIENARKGMPTRSYSYDRATNTFHFSGLTISMADQKAVTQIAGNPHNGKATKPDELIAGNPHNGRIQWPKPSQDIYGSGSSTAISSSEEQNAYVIARVTDLEKLMSTQLELGRIVKASGARQILIRSVEGLSTPNILSLLRILGSCSSCVIDQFLVISEDKQDKTPSLELLVPAISELRLSFGDKVQFTKEISLLDRLAQLTVLILKDERVYQAVNPKHLQEFHNVWKTVLNELTFKILTEQQDEQISKIMQRIP
ncbi:MAG: serine protease [Bdellovibrionales bacterium]